MALRQEDLALRRLGLEDAQVVAFPTTAVRRRAARQRQTVFLQRRIAVALASLLAAAALGIALGGAADPVRSAPGSPRAVRIEAGQTIWGLAATYAPDADPRAFVDEVMRLNDFEGAPIPGTRVRLPRS